MVRCVALLSVLAFVLSSSAGAQAYRPDPAPGEQGSGNIKVVSHLPLNVAAPFNTSDIEIEQELSRPYAYVSAQRNGYQIINLKNPEKASVLYSW